MYHIVGKHGGMSSSLATVVSETVHDQFYKHHSIKKWEHLSCLSRDHPQNDVHP